MSFILDALQKDQVDQQPEPQPTGMLPPLKPSPLKRWGLGLLGVALLVNAGVLAWYLLSQQSGSSSGSNITPSVPGAQRELSMTPPPNRAARSEPNSLPKRSPVREPVREPMAAATRPTRPSTGNATPPRAPQAPAKASSQRSTPASGAGRVLSPEQAAQMGIGDDLLTGPETTVSQTSSATTTDTGADNAPTANTEPTKARAFDAITIAELPAAARDSFPELEFSTHIFADDPSMRAVVVNDTRLSEGEQLGELILRAVTEDGVVFGYRNHLVAVSVVDLWAE